MGSAVTPRASTPPPRPLSSKHITGANPTAPSFPCRVEEEVGPEAGAAVVLDDHMVLGAVPAAAVGRRLLFETRQRMKG